MLRIWDDMQTQEQWMNLYKQELEIPSDRQLSIHWNTTTAEIRQLKTGKRKLSVARKLMIAQALDLDPMQIFISCEFYKAREDEKDFLKSEYFKSVIKTYNVRVPVGFYKKRRTRVR